VEPAVSSSGGGSTSSINRIGVASGTQPPPPHIVIDGSSLSTQAQLRIMQRRMSISTRQILSASQSQSINQSQKYAVRTAAGTGALAAGAASSGSSGQELINPQIYKIVTTDGSTSNVIIDASAAAPPHNSKLLLSNLTVLSKQAPVQGAAGQQQQQLNYLGAKSLPYVSASPAKTQQQPQKFGSISAFKAQHQQQQQHPHATLQKVTLGSRVATRLQSYVPASPSQIMVQPAQPKYVNATATTIGGNAALLKKANQKITVKSVSNMSQQQQQQQQQQLLQAQQLKTFITQQQQQQTYKAGAKAKFVKQTTALSIAALPQQQQQQQQTTYAKQSMVTTSTPAKVTKLNSKYVQQQISLPQGTQLQHKASPNVTGGGYLLQQSQAAGGGTIKFVNSHGTVIQQHPQQQQATKRTHYNSSGSSDNEQHAVANSSLITDDVMIVNGTQMTDELSARILQSMAQKSFSQQQRFHQVPATGSGNMPPPTQIIYSNSTSNGAAASSPVDASIFYGFFFAYCVSPYLIAYSFFN